MAKKSVIAREKVKTKVASKFATKLQGIKEALRLATTFEEQMKASDELQSLPRNASPCRGVRRCRSKNCGRPKGVYRKFGLCRIHLREAMMRGDVTGCRKSSW